MLEESVSTAWVNWTTVLRNILALPVIVFAINYLWRVLGNRKELVKRIGAKYYPCINIVKTVRWEADKVTQDSLERLKSVNALLNMFHKELQDIPNNGSVSDIEMEEVRRCFSSGACSCVLTIQDLFGKLDGEGKSVDEQVSSDNVMRLSDMILREWRKLVSIMARKCWRRSDSIEREYLDRYNGL